MFSKHNEHRFSRRGAAVATVAVTGTVLVGFAALAIDMGVFYNTRVEAQRSADAGALAGAWRLLGDERLKGSTAVTALVDQTRLSAAQTAGLNYVFKKGPTVDLNAANALNGDIVLGRLERPQDRTEPIATNVSPNNYNSVSVLVRRDQVRNGPIPFFFGQIFGFRNKDMSASAVANAQNRIAGYRVTKLSGNAKLLPFALSVTAWTNLNNGSWSMGDKLRYDSASKLVSRGPDGLGELNLYPGSGSEVGSGDQLPPGNFGTLDIGGQDNSSAVISRQIREGMSIEDLAPHGGELRFDADGKIFLNGDTGISAGFKDDLLAIKGQTRALPLFNAVSGPGNNATYTIVAFAGVRVMDIDLTGSMSKKRVVIQPAVVVDASAIGDETEEPSFAVFTPPTLVR